MSADNESTSGLFSATTAAHLTTYQQAAGLPVTQTSDVQTWHALTTR